MLCVVPVSYTDCALLSWLACVGRDSGVPNREFLHTFHVRVI